LKNPLKFGSIINKIGGHVCEETKQKMQASAGALNPVRLSLVKEYQ